MLCVLEGSRALDCVVGRCCECVVPLKCVAEGSDSCWKGEEQERVQCDLKGSRALVSVAGVCCVSVECLTKCCRVLCVAFGKRAQ